MVKKVDEGELPRDDGDVQQPPKQGDVKRSSTKYMILVVGLFIVLVAAFSLS